MTSCCFCSPADGPEARVFGSRVCWEDEAFYVTPTIGELAPEHLLLVPWAHVPSFTHLGPSEIHSAEDILRRHIDLLAAPDSKVVIFEHGMASHSAAGGCGISHAHLHLVNVPRSLTIEPLPEPDDETWSPLEPRQPLVDLGDRSGYLLVGCEEQWWARSVEDLPSQYLRRWLAGRLGLQDWDWREAEPGSLGQRADAVRMLHREAGAARVGAEIAWVGSTFEARQTEVAARLIR
jgi:diadenosine tetraphosphate (Ap4A) HIT family hydrolase